jgi:hypothetical protein
MDHACAYKERGTLEDVIPLWCLKETPVVWGCPFQNLWFLPRLQWHCQTCDHSCGYLQQRWTSGVPRAFATIVTTSTPLALVASAFMLVRWMLLKRRQLIRWTQTDSWVFLGWLFLFQARGRAACRRGSDAMWGSITATTTKLGPSLTILGDKSLD